MFIQTEATPNPATLKFLPGRSVMGDGTLDMKSSEAASASPLARSLFSIDHVSSVFFGPDFISVTKGAGEWQHMKPAILGAIMEHFMSGAALLSEGAGAGAEEEFFDPADSETVSTIKEMLEARVRPAVAGDGGDISFRGFRMSFVNGDFEKWHREFAQTLRPGSSRRGANVNPPLMANLEITRIG